MERPLTVRPYLYGRYILGLSVTFKIVILPWIVCITKKSNPLKTVEVDFVAR